jgi:hypothetical protein
MIIRWIKLRSERENTSYRKEVKWVLFCSNEKKTEKDRNCVANRFVILFWLNVLSFRPFSNWTDPHLQNDCWNGWKTASGYQRFYFFNWWLCRFCATSLTTVNRGRKPFHQPSIQNVWKQAKSCTMVVQHLYTPFLLWWTHQGCFSERDGLVLNMPVVHEGIRTTYVFNNFYENTYEVSCMVRLWR